MLRVIAFLIIMLPSVSYAGLTWSDEEPPARRFDAIGMKGVRDLWVQFHTYTQGDTCSTPREQLLKGTEVLNQNNAPRIVTSGIVSKLILTTTSKPSSNGGCISSIHALVIHTPIGGRSTYMFDSHYVVESPSPRAHKEDIVKGIEVLSEDLLQAWRAHNPI